MWLNKIWLKLNGYEFMECWDYKLEHAEFRWQKTLLPYGWDVWEPIDVKYNKKRMTTMYYLVVYRRKKIRI